MQSFEHIPMILQPRNLNIDLFPHQLASVYKMEQLERAKQIQLDNYTINTKIGINGNITGYGKTLAMVTLILRDEMEWDMDTQHRVDITTVYSMSLITKQMPYYHTKINTTLILVNQPLIEQWENEFSHTNLRIGVVTTRKSADTIIAPEYDAILVTPTMFNRFVDRYYGMAWKRFIFDEPGHIKVPKMRSVIFGFMWLVTATPQSIILKHQKCKSSFMRILFDNFNWHFQDQIFNSINISNDEKFVRQSWQLPPTHHNYYECFSPVYRALNGLVNDKIIAMADANNISGIISLLGGNQTSNITDLVRTKKNDELRAIVNIYTLENDDEKVAVWKEKENRIRTQLKELDRRMDDLLNKECTICYNKLISPVMEPLCQNIFCAKCLLTWIKTNRACPLCRQQINPASLIYISTDQTGDESKEHILPTKEKMIVDIIKNKKKGRFIIFSSYNETFSRITSVLTINKISFIEAKGNIKIMNNRIKKFKDGTIPVIFLNSKHQGAGLNLQEATDVIIYHKMSDDLLCQVLGRPNRIGRTEPLQVHHLIYK